ncbi:hypothetical protein CMI37_15010, partial [Candidatus Pacearchaeota archaeon]|nr:hypothetical protein [Candidatus Pacearchaeota archaeon]
MLIVPGAGAADANTYLIDDSRQVTASQITFSSAGGLTATGALTLTPTGGDIEVPEGDVHIDAGRLECKEDGYTGVYMRAWGTAVYPYIWAGRGRGTEAAQTAVQDNDVLFEVEAAGAVNSSSIIPGGELFFYADENWNATSAGTRFEILVTPTGTTSRATRLTADTDGVIIGGTGRLRAPVGTTAQRPTASNGDIRYNSTTSRMEQYAGGAWDDIGDAVTGTLSDDCILRYEGSTDTIENTSISTDGGGIVTLTHASQPKFVVVDSTNSVTVFMQAGNTTGNYGTSSNHDVLFYANNTLAGTLSAAGDWTLDNVT